MSDFRELLEFAAAVNDAVRAMASESIRRGAMILDLEFLTGRSKRSLLDERYVSTLPFDEWYRTVKAKAMAAKSLNDD